MNPLSLCQPACLSDLPYRRRRAWRSSTRASGCGFELAGKQAAGERHTRDEADPFGLGGGQEFVDEFLAEDVEDNLQAGEAVLL